MNRRVLILVAGFCLIALPVQAQVMREAGAGSIVGTLDDVDDPYDEYLFRSDGDLILFADLDAEVYLEPGAGHGGGCEDAATASLADEGTNDGTEGSSGGCGSDGGSSGGCGSDGGSSGGCGCDDGGGGPGQFRLEVFLEGEPDPLCAAGRPKRPGWDRDPRLACQLTEEGEYVLRVSLSSPGGGHEALMDEAASTYVYLLNVTVRGAARDGSSLRKALIESADQFTSRN